MAEFRDLTEEEVERVKALTAEIEEAPTVEKINELFNIYDRNGDGKVEREELRLVMSRVMPEDADERSINEMIADLDTNGDGMIDVDELVKNVMDHFKD